MLDDDQDCCRWNGAKIKGVGRRPSPQDCYAECDRVEECQFFSHSTRYKRGLCILCSACDLSGASKGKYYSSWAKAADALVVRNSAAVRPVSPLVKQVRVANLTASPPSYTTAERSEPLQLEAERQDAIAEFENGIGQDDAIGSGQDDEIGSGQGDAQEAMMEEATTEKEDRPTSAIPAFTVAAAAGAAALLAAVAVGVFLCRRRRTTTARPSAEPKEGATPCTREDEEAGTAPTVATGPERRSTHMSGHL